MRVWGWVIGFLVAFAVAVVLVDAPIVIVAIPILRYLQPTTPLGLSAGCAVLAVILFVVARFSVPRLMSTVVRVAGYRVPELWDAATRLPRYDSLPARTRAIWSREKYLLMNFARANFQYVNGDSAGGAEHATVYLEWLRPSAPSKALPRVVTYILTAAGRYLEALSFEDAVSVGPPDGVLVEQVNLAEAEFNLGLWSEAWARLERLDSRALSQFAIARAGKAFTDAWILAHLGLGDRAAEVAYSYPPTDLPPDYQAECHFARCAARFAQGRLDDAMQELLEGRRLSKRASSFRNALFLEARLLEAMGDVERALVKCEEAANHKFKGQGGDGLLFWGDTLNRLGRTEQARAAWTLAVERDPESESAAEARTRLSG